MSINSCNSTQLTLLTQLNETDITYRISTYVAYPLGLMTSLLWCATSSLDDKILTSEQRIWLTELMEGFLTNSCVIALPMLALQLVAGLHLAH